MDNPELIEKYEDELQGLLTRMNTDGIRPEVVHFVLKQALNKVELQTQAKIELA